jgi:hypothetical protein
VLVAAFHHRGPRAAARPARVSRWSGRVAGRTTAARSRQLDLTRIAPDRQRAEVSAAFYVCIYLGVSVPVIGIGLVAVATTLFTAVTTFAVVTGVGALVLAAWHLRNRGGTARQTTHTAARQEESLVRSGQGT